MNESEFEAKLRAFEPAAPSATLARAIADDLQLPAASIARARTRLSAEETEGLLSRLLGGLPWALGGAVAAWAVMLSMEAPAVRTVASPMLATQTTPPMTAAAGGVFQPEQSSREVIETEEGALVFPEERKPSRLVRVTSMERRTWANPATGAQIAVELPREDLVLVPVSYQ